MMKVPFRHMLVYLDGSEGSMNALMYAILLAKSTGASLSALYVVNTKAIGDLVRSRIFIDQERTEFLSDLQKDAKRHLRHAERLAASKDLDITTATVEGSPHHAVLDYMKSHDVDLLILGSVNVIRSRRDELTGENDRMLRTSPCPVIVVRGEDDIWAEFEEV